MNHEPMTLFECVGPTSAWILIVQSAILAVLYGVIALGRFLPAGNASRSMEERNAWYSIMVLFLTCGCNGHLTTIISGWHPAWGYFLKEVVMTLCIFAASFFIASTRSVNLVIEHQNHRIDRARLALEKKRNPAELIAELKEILSDIDH